MRKIKLGLLPRIILAIVAGIVCWFVFPGGLVRIFITINSLFGIFGLYYSFAYFRISRSGYC